MSLLRALAAEQLKIKRTLALWLAPLAPLVIVGLQVAIVLQRPEYYTSLEIGDPWLEYSGQIVFLWTVLMLPLFITLETALLGQLEHGNRQWKHLFALPTPRGAIYAAKQIGAMAIIGLSAAALFVYVVASALALEWLVPGLGLVPPIPWAMLFRFIALSYVASWLILAVHTWVALRWPSFVVASAVGIAAVVVAVIVFQSDYAPWYPWTLPGMVVHNLEMGDPILPQLLAGGLGGLAVALLGAWDALRRDVA